MGEISRKKNHEKADHGGTWFFGGAQGRRPPKRKAAPALWRARKVVDDTFLRRGHQITKPFVAKSDGNGGGGAKVSIDTTTQ